MPGVLIGVLIVGLIRFLQRRSGRSIWTSATTGRQLIWYFWVVASLSFSLIALSFIAGIFVDGGPVPVIGAMIFVPTMAVVDVVVFAPFLLLRPIAKLGRVKLAYYASHWFLHGQGTAEPYAAASLVAYLALSHRGEPTRAELDWVNLRFEKETRALGVFGVAFGLMEALEANLARREGRIQEARDRRERARVLFGTTTYLSTVALPSHLRVLANDYLVLDSIRRGEWGVVESFKPKELSRTALFLRHWVRANLLKDTGLLPTKGFESATPPPIVAHLKTRSEQRPVLDDDGAFAAMSRSYVALVKGQRPSPRAILNMLTALDVFFDPRSPKHRLPPEIASDDEAADAIAESIADAVTAALRDRGAPLFALRFHGTVSARVYQKLESAVTNDLTIALKAIRERAERRLRGTPKDEWLEVSRVRGLYRTIEFTLGTQAAGAFASQMFYDYGRLGVMLSETFPRRRPLAHAVFHCLHDEAVRFGNAEAQRRELKNMGVTSRVD
ncbi:MAG TPA: hypothetical protein VF407_08705 [Polyangiaceae bacterium]